MIKLKILGKDLELEAAGGLVSLYDEESDDLLWEIDLAYWDEIERGLVQLIEMIRKEK